MAACRTGILLWVCVCHALVSWCPAGVVGEIPDDVVYTDLHKTVKLGDSVVMKCQFRGTPLAVYWKKGDDPRTAPNLVSWIPGDPVTGLCEGERPCQIMEMNEDFSLIIKEVSTAEQGRYICRVSSYKGILIHNFTDIRVFSPPIEPFPVIDECVESESFTLNTTQPCHVLSNTSIVLISCMVKNYYSDIDLFFLHGPQKIKDTASNEWINDDGTKNKSISIKASPSETPYVCIASDIPGSNDQRAATILVKSLKPTESTITVPQGLPNSSLSKGKKMDTPNDNTAAKIAAPIVVVMVFVVAIGLVMFFVFRRRGRFPSEETPKHHTSGQTTTSTGRTESEKETEEQVALLGKAKIDGDISFYELWSLAYDTREDDKMRLHQVLIKLGIKDVTEGMTTAKIYDRLCKWKGENKISDQAELLRKALERADFESRWIQLCEQRKGTYSKVSLETLEQIIIEIENPGQIQQFLCKLIPNCHCNIDVKGKKKDADEEAMKVIREWSKGPFEGNPFALLSLALERSACCPLDRIFFGEIISFFELWSLSHYMKDYDIEGKYSVFEELGLVVEDRLTREELYVLLCSWKDSSKTISQGKRLRDALDQANLRKRWKDMKDLRRGDNIQISQHTLEHILWHIKDPKKIDQFLQQLTLGDPGMQADVTRGLRDTIQEAVIRLNTWAKKRFDENPFVLLSLALEKTRCCPIDRTFFKVPHVLTRDIEELKVQLFVDSLTSRHIKALTKCLDIGKTEETMTKENKETMFDTESMISDWITQEECSNYEKRWKMNKAVDCVGRQDLKEFFGEMKPAMHIGVDYEDTVQGGKFDYQRSDFIREEYQRIATYLSPSQIKNLFGHVGFSGDFRSAVQSYAEHQMAKKSKKDVREKLREKLKSVGLQDLIPSELEHSVYLCELLDVAFRLLLEDVYPLAKALGISDEKLQDYRVNYAPHHLTKGTTAILIKLSEANNNGRSIVCQALYDAGYTDIARLLEYGHETSFADKIAVVSRVGNDGEALVKISQSLRMSKNGNTDTVLRDWKAVVHPPSYNQRTSLADAVFPVLGVDVAIAILSGKYRASSSESLAVIQEIISGVESFEQHFISKVLSGDDAQKLLDQRTIAQTEGTSLLGQSGKMSTAIGIADKSAVVRRLAHILGVRVAPYSSAQKISTRQVLETWGTKTSLGRDDRKMLSDNLLRAGFKEFAFEVMTGSVPSRKNKFPWKRGTQRKEGKQQDKLDQGEPTIKERSYWSCITDSGDEVIKDSGEPAIKESGYWACIKDSGNQAIKDSIEPTIEESSYLSCITESGEQDIKDSGEPTIKESGYWSCIKDIGNQVIKDSIEPTIEESSYLSCITESGEQDIKDSGEPAIKESGYLSCIKDSDNQAIKHSGEWLGIKNDA